ncbi:MAG: BspA family leucine-rich repeat surface protein, partial [Oscillibacter sp.]|nr:BspA family leucine-rich repeat surface protein [Oscillibacter sp.]
MHMGKRLGLFLLVLCAALGLAETAAAYELRGAELSDNRSGVTVRLAAEGNCTLAAGAYSREGKLLEYQSVSLTRKTGEQTETITFSAPLPEGGEARAFLLSGSLVPLCPRVTTTGGGAANPGAWDVYAILYSDGTLVFQHGNTPEAGRTVVETYAVAEDWYDYNLDAKTFGTPWYDKRLDILAVDFAETIRPFSTDAWFANCENLKSVQHPQNLDTSGVEFMDAMFYGCSSLTALDVSKWDTGNVRDMAFM